MVANFIFDRFQIAQNFEESWYLLHGNEGMTKEGKICFNCNKRIRYLALPCINGKCVAFISKKRGVFSPKEKIEATPYFARHCGCSFFVIVDGQGNGIECFDEKGCSMPIPKYHNVDPEHNDSNEAFSFAEKATAEFWNNFKSMYNKEKNSFLYDFVNGTMSAVIASARRRFYVEQGVEDLPEVEYSGDNALTVLQKRILKIADEAALIAFDRMNSYASFALPSFHIMQEHFRKKLHESFKPLFVDDIHKTCFKYERERQAKGLSTTPDLAMDFRKMADKEVIEIIESWGGGVKSPGGVSPKPYKQRRFSVALSFSGNQRIWADKIANGLTKYLNKEKIFYDKFYTGELARPNLCDYLQEIYGEDTDLVVVFLSSSYDEKEWCNIERRAIWSHLLNKGENDRLMFLRCYEGEVKGVFYNVDGYIDLRTTPISNVI